MILHTSVVLFFVSSRRRHTRCALVTGVQTCALPIFQVEAYGANMPLNQVGSIAVPEPRMVTVQVWDRGMVGAVERAIRESGLGLNPASDGQQIGRASCRDRVCQYV